MNYDKFILFGDSITQFSNQIVDGFALQPALQETYIRRLDILNRGFSGYNSEHARLILPKILESELNESKDNVKMMNNVKPIVIGPSLHDPNILAESSGGEVQTEVATCERYWHYAQGAKNVCQKYNVPFIDLWEEFRNDGGWTKEQLFSFRKDSPESQVGSLGSYLNDGIHFTPKAYKILHTAIMNTIEQHYPEFLPESLPYKLAYWGDIDPKSLKSIFKT